MEEIEVSSWATLDALKKAADIIDTVGDLHESHQVSIFCVIEDDYLELCYTDSSTNHLRRFEDYEAFEEAIEERKEEIEEGLYAGQDYEDQEDDIEEELDFEDEPDEF